ncbi:MAG TPA: glycosyl hydrolase, partial [Bacteroidetes bacterium]|nr:glycosyl hydrolase [Bacteroidota bacterium]
NTAVEYYCTIFAAAESPRKEGLLWTGSDDGLVHISQDGGKNWEDVTPPNMPKWAMVNSIEPSPFEDGGCYLAATLYKAGDYRPYLYKTTDFGKTWTKIINGIPDNHFTRVVRVDPNKRGYLYAGTESGAYVSFDDGANWQPLQLNLPIVPITDMAVKNNNLIAATQGRGLWIIDDLTILQQLNKNIASEKFHLFKPMDSYRMPGYQIKEPKGKGTNHKGGVTVHYYLPNIDTANTEIKIAFLEMDGDIIREFSSKAKKKENKLKAKKGANTFNWNMRYEKAKDFKGMILWWASTNGPKALPGEYKIQLTVGEDTQEKVFKILKDPRSEVSEKDMQAQFDFLMDIKNKISESHETIGDIKEIRSQIKSFTKRLDKEDEKLKPVFDKAEAIDSIMTEVEEALYQTKNRARQDPLNFPIRLTNKLGHLTSLTGGDYPPTDQAEKLKNELFAEIDGWLEKYKTVKEKELPAFNKMVRDMEVDFIKLKLK